MKRKIRLTEGDLHRIVRQYINEVIDTIDNQPCFPHNSRVNVNFNENSNLIFICGQYHGRYEDDDCEILCYDINTKKFTKKGETTRGSVPSYYCYNNFSYRNINDCDSSLQEEIFNAAKKEAYRHKQEILQKISEYLFRLFPKSYSRKGVENALNMFEQRFDEFVDNAPNIPTAISLFYNAPLDGYDTSEFFKHYMLETVDAFGIQIKSQMNRKIKLAGQNFTGRVVKNEIVNTRFGRCSKIGIIVDELGKSVWAYIKSDDAQRGDEITINGVISNETDRSITLSKAKRIDNVDPSLLNESKLYNLVKYQIKKYLAEARKY